MTVNPPTLSILVVEDEMLVRMVAVEILSEMGATPYEAGDADEALFMLAAHPGIVVLFTDVNMPGSMDGIELAARVRQARPDIAIIVTSGVRKNIANPAPPEIGTFLPKPYRAQQLVAAVEQELARAA